jgi:riboflavin synthase alpha subunit
MFTGIVRDRGTITEVQHVPGGLEVVIDTRLLPTDLELGSSVAVNGVCLTVTERSETDSGYLVRFFVGPETLARTTLGTVSAGSVVNLEPALRLGDPLGGHAVSGHVDGTARLVRVHLDGEVKWLTWEVPEGLMQWIVPQGSVCLGGVSLTVAAVELPKNHISVMVIPHTLAVTTLGTLKEGSAIELECDQTTKTIVEVVRRILPQALQPELDRKR